MKHSLTGNLLLVFGLSLLLAFLASRTCERHPELARWMGGQCWFAGTTETPAPAIAHYTNAYFLSTKGGSYDLDVAKSALYALGQNATKEARDGLMRIVRSDAPVELRKTALHALGQHAGADFVRLLEEIALSDEPLELRKTAVHVLESIGSDASRTALIEVLHATIAEEGRR